MRDTKKYEMWSLSTGAVRARESTLNSSDKGRFLGVVGVVLSGRWELSAEDRREFLVRAEMILDMLCVSGVTVCVLALATLQPGTVGDTLLLTRLEKDNPPVTVQIPTAQNKVGFPGQQAKLGWGWHSVAGGW